MNLMLTIAFGVIALVLSFGFPVPQEFSAFRLIAALGVIVGYQAGQLVSRLVRPRPKRFLTLSVSILFCCYFVFAYIRTLQTGSANTSDIVNLSVLFGLSFFWLGFLLPFTRIPKELNILSSKAIERFARRSGD
jgi:drug/metabolite transporter (DMT)-like permease